MSSNKTANLGLSQFAAGDEVLRSDFNSDNNIIDSYYKSLSDSLANHNHAASNITSGTLGTARGGTGITSNPSMLVNLASTTAASVFATSPRPGVTGVLPIANGGTGTTSTSGILSALGLSSVPKMGVISVAGTGEQSISLSFGFRPDFMLYWCLDSGTPDLLMFCVRGESTIRLFSYGSGDTPNWGTTGTAFIKISWGTSTTKITFVQTATSHDYYYGKLNGSSYNYVAVGFKA